MVNWQDPDWPKPGEKAVIHYKVETWNVPVAPGSNQTKTTSKVDRLLVVGTDPFGPGGSLDGRIRRDEARTPLARVVARGKIEGDLHFDAFAGEVFKRVVHLDNDDETRALAAEQTLLIKSSGETPAPRCMSCCRKRLEDPAVKFHRRTMFGWKIGVNSNTSAIPDGGPAIVSDTVCLVCLQSRYDSVAQIRVSPKTPAEELLSSSYWGVNDSALIVKLCGPHGFKVGLDQLAKVVAEVRNS